MTTLEIVPVVDSRNVRPLLCRKTALLRPDATDAVFHPTCRWRYCGAAPGQVSAILSVLVALLMFTLRVCFTPYAQSVIE